MGSRVKTILHVKATYVGGPISGGGPLQILF